MNQFESPENKEITRGEARQHIEAVRAQIMSMGANDSENESLNTIIQQMEDGVITSAEAVAQANAVRDSKQDYH